MTNVAVSADGQIALPTAPRLKLGLDTGAELERSEESDGARLRFLRAKPRTNDEALAGLATAPSRGRPRRLEELDPASMLAQEPGAGA